MGFDDACLEVPRVRQTTQRPAPARAPCCTLLSPPLPPTCLARVCSECALSHGRLSLCTGTLLCSPLLPPLTALARRCTSLRPRSRPPSPLPSCPTSPSSSSWPPLASHSTSPRKHCACPIQPPLLRMSLIKYLVYQKQPSFAKSQSHPPLASSEGSVSWPCSTRSACICSILGVGEQYTAWSDVGIRGSGATTGSVVGTPAVFAFHALRPSPRVSDRS